MPAKICLVWQKIPRCWAYRQLSNKLYFCGDKSEIYVFFQIYRQLTTGPKCRRVSTDAKPLHGKLPDHMRLSRRNG